MDAAPAAKRRRKRGRGRRSVVLPGCGQMHPGGLGPCRKHLLYRQSGVFHRVHVAGSGDLQLFWPLEDESAPRRRRGRKRSS